MGHSKLGSPSCRMPMSHCSCVLVSSVLGPCRANVKNEADQERKHKVQDGYDDPLAYAQVADGGHFEVVVVLDLGRECNRVDVLLLWLSEIAFIAVVISNFFILAFEQAVLVLVQHNIINTSE